MEQQADFLKLVFTQKDIGKIYDVRKKTFSRRLKEYGLSQYEIQCTVISVYDLEMTVRDIVDFPIRAFEW